MALLMESLGYPIYMESDIESFTERYKKLKQCYGKTVVITDKTVFSYYGVLLNQLGDPVYLVEGGEQSKSIEEAGEIISYLAESGITRKDLVVAFGGGIIGDLVGFVASTYMRGIAWLSVPTTLLSQVDSSIGGKTGVNIPQGKNLMGSFYNAASVIVCTQFLETLNQTELKSGYGELLKYACLMGLDITKMIEDILIPSKRDVWIRLALQIKAALVAIDYREINERRYLNLGHTFGHALESYERYQTPHGECVGLGLREILKLQLFMNQNNNLKWIRNYLEQLNKALLALNFRAIHVSDWQRLLGFLSRDKKADQAGIHMVWFKLERIAEPINIEDIVMWTPEMIVKRIRDCCCIEQVSLESIAAYLKEANMEEMTLKE